ncbi:MerR family transcriptional regulator [Streptomyces chumphonensis]|uniref:MerR family transcriptional regulator n=1 Tax=Streptomyces chumphonensis TaxID=1214925 RepID=A0A927IF83_9ACTN|nr:MerR family transcriptional regulator [Streptomyces chumphonensis]MBD3934665.1 MerR family transcriptional regulator [Streptomyces chumphonensis]
MRLAELSGRSGVPTATIKYYLREGLLPPGERVTATQAEYGEEHVRRLGLVRALIQVGRVPVATAKEVLHAIEDASLPHDARLGIAVESLPPPRGSAVDPEVLEAAGGRVAELRNALGWDHATTSVGQEMLVTAVATLMQLGYPCSAEHLMPYARLAGELAAHDMDLVEGFETPTTQLEAAVALTVLYEPVLLGLRRMAHAEEATRRYGKGVGTRS